MTIQRPASRQSADPTAEPVPGPTGLRADARRNYDALLAAGHTVFAEQGVDAPMDEIAREAGVGRATLYRHFPTREHLFAALVHDQVALLERRARELADAADSGHAVIEWLRLYDRSARQYRGMSQRVAEALADAGSPVAVACAPMKRAFEALFARARRDGTIRKDATALDILTLVATLPEQTGRRRSAGIHLAIVLDGLQPPGRTAER